MTLSPPAVKIWIRSFTSVQMFHTHTHTHPETFTQRSFYTQALLHREAFTHRCSFPGLILHTRVFHMADLRTVTFTHRRFHTQMHLETDDFFTKPLLHSRAFTQRSFYIHMPLHKESFYTKKLLHAVTFRHRSFYTQRLNCTQALLHREAFTHREAFRQSSFYRQTRLHTNLCHRAASARFKILVLPQDLTFDIISRAEHLTLQTRNCTPVRDACEMCAKGFHLTQNHKICQSISEHLRLQFYINRYHLIVMSCEGVASEVFKPELSSFCDIQPSCCEWVVWRPTKFAFHQTFERPTSTISDKGHVSIGAAPCRHRRGIHT